ncbi:unnamed protein product [Closterium sp. NIES-65]|nr:unnamed protein product [Closterium sp. NIES-65]
MGFAHGLSFTPAAPPTPVPRSSSHGLSFSAAPSPTAMALSFTPAAHPTPVPRSSSHHHLTLLSASLSGDLPITANELPVAVFAVDRDLVCALWNRRMAELTGWAEGEIMRLGRFAEGRFAERLFRPASASAPFRRCEDVLRAALFGRDIVTAELLLLKRGGSCARVRLFASARTDALGAVCGAICAVIPASSGGGGGSAAALSATSAHGFDVDGGGGGGGGSGGGLPPFAPSFAAGETEEWLQRNASAGSLYGMHSVDEESVGDDSDAASSCSDLYQLGSAPFGSSASCGGNSGGSRRHVMEPVSASRRASGGGGGLRGGYAGAGNAGAGQDSGAGAGVGVTGRLSSSSSERQLSGRLSLGESEAATESGAAGGAGGAGGVGGAGGADEAGEATLPLTPPATPPSAAPVAPVLPSPVNLPTLVGLGAEGVGGGAVGGTGVHLKPVQTKLAIRRSCELPKYGALPFQCPCIEASVPYAFAGLSNCCQVS